jgi:hypothetical protein
MDDDDENSNKIFFALTVFFDYLGPRFPQLPWIIGALLYVRLFSFYPQANDVGKAHSLVPGTATAFCGYHQDTSQSSRLDAIHLQNVFSQDL